jgi:hypothetical protein
VPHSRRIVARDPHQEERQENADAAMEKTCRGRNVRCVHRDQRGLGQDGRSDGAERNPGRMTDQGKRHRSDG